MEHDAETTNPASDVVSSSAPSVAGLLWVFPFAEPWFSPVRERSVVGRASSCDILLEERQVSREHVGLRRDGPLLIAEDLGSRNGTYHDGQLFTRGGLAHGSVLRVGEALAVVWNAPRPSEFSFHELASGLFGGARLAHALRDLEKLSRSDLPVIVSGPSGSGKERIASAIASRSQRRGGLLAINCAAIPEHLAESQLFGHKKGAFTGADRTELGYFEAVNGGTLFLDEIQELTPRLQAKLLRVLQEKEITRVGETTPRPVDVRLVVSSQTRIEDAVQAGRFRDDLFARLNGYRIDLPPLRQRKEDIPFLFRVFLRQALHQSSLPELKVGLIERLCVYDWPHNVRGLKLLVERLAALHGDSSQLRTEHLPLEILTEKPAGNTTSMEESPLHRDRELNELVRALNRHEGNVLQAARQLGISRGRAYRLISAARLDLPGLRSRVTEN